MPLPVESDVSNGVEPEHRFSVAVHDGYINVGISILDGEYQVDFNSTHRDLSDPTRYRASHTFNCDELLALADCATKAWAWIQEDLR